jgi:hypothetical protein
MQCLFRVSNSPLRQKLEWRSVEGAEAGVGGAGREFSRFACQRGDLSLYFIQFQKYPKEAGYGYCP